jgi:hypothetical protein
MDSLPEEIDLTGYTLMEIGSNLLLLISPDGKCRYTCSYWPLAAAIPEIIGAGAETGAVAGGAEAAGAGVGAEAGAGAGAAAEAPSGGAGGMLRDFNDSPIGKIAGSRFGQNALMNQGMHMAGGLFHTAESAIGTGPREERENIGPMGNLA